MIVDGILLLVQGILNILLAPLSALNIAIDFISSITVVRDFLQISAYLLPMDNLKPLFTIVIGIFIFRATLAIIRTIWKFIPVIGN